MTQPSHRSEKLRQFIHEFFDGRQKRLSEEYGVSQSLISTWLSSKNEKSDVPVYMDKIIDLHREISAYSTELEAMRVGRVLEMKTGFAIVQFANETAPGTILCCGIPDLETANRVLAALRANETAYNSEES